MARKGRKMKEQEDPKKLLLERIKKMPSGCWEWQGYKHTSGYGAIMFGAKAWVASRLSWTVFRSSIPTGMLVCHTCDNPPCINPAHLWLGTYKQNSDDKISKKRDFHPSRPRVLSEQKVRAILAEPLTVSNLKLSKKYKMCNSAIGRVRSNKIWKHIQRDKAKLQIYLEHWKNMGHFSKRLK